MSGLTHILEMKLIFDEKLNRIEFRDPEDNKNFIFFYHTLEGCKQ